MKFRNFYLGRFHLNVQPPHFPVGRKSDECFLFEVKVGGDITGAFVDVDPVEAWREVFEEAA